MCKRALWRRLCGTRTCMPRGKLFQCSSSWCRNFFSLNFISCTFMCFIRFVMLPVLAAVTLFQLLCCALLALSQVKLSYTFDLFDHILTPFRAEIQTIQPGNSLWKYNNTYTWLWAWPMKKPFPGSLDTANPHFFIAAFQACCVLLPIGSLTLMRVTSSGRYRNLVPGINAVQY